MADLGVHRPGACRFEGVIERDLAVSFGNGHVLVVARSRVNLIVVSEIVQRCGLKAIAHTIDDAGDHLRSARPCLVILDAGHDNRDCDGICDDIAGLQRSSGTGMPRVILLLSRNGAAEDLALPARVDAVVAKPITPETLQPVVDRLARGKA